MTHTVTRETYEQWRATMRARDNLPYGYGGAFSATNLRASTDCSGLTMSDAAFLMGLDWDRRYGSTESFRVGAPVVYDLGFLPGPGPNNTIMRVGLHHGVGGGPNSHTAATIFADGGRIDHESSGSYGVQLGPPARGWDHPMFTGQPWHLDAVLEDEFLSALTPDQQMLVLGAALQTGRPHVNAMA